MTQEQVTIQHHRLVDQYKPLIDQARSLPGFDNFMRPKKATELMSAARRGPIVVVNIYADRCDALILRPSSDEITHVTLPDLSQDGVAQLHEQMQRSLESKGLRLRKLQRPYEKPGNHFFVDILAALWHKLVKPVIDFLGYTVRIRRVDLSTVY